MTPYTQSVIISFRNRGLKALYEGRTTRKVSPGHIVKLRDILALLDRARSAQDLALPGLGLHALKGKQQEHYAVSVSGNWRVTFRFERGDARDVDYVDYH